jgi:signal transduction histidine kinase
MSLRGRLLAITSLTLAAGMFLLCLAGNVLLARTVDADQHQRLDTRLEAVTASLSVDRAGRIRINTLDDSLLDTFAWVLDAHGRLLEGPSRAPSVLARMALGLARSRRSSSTLAPGEILLGTHRVRDSGRLLATVVAAVSVAQLQALRREVLVGSTLVALLTLLGGVAAIRSALSGALAPVEQMTRDAEDWGAHDLDRRFALGPGRDEITALAVTLDHLLERIASSRRHEQQFAAEVAHELRTPLAAILGIAQLAVDAPELDEARAALAQIEDHSRRIAATLDTLIAFARRESSRAAEGVDLEAVVAQFDGVHVRRAPAPLPRVGGDPALIRQTLAPLVDNAHRHAVSSVTIELSATHDRALVTVRDDGPGIDPALGSNAFLPGVRGAEEPGDGAGLGLPLALRLACSCGGELTLGDGPGGCFVLSLPALGHAPNLGDP